jgi:hypothetical protein
MTRFAVGWRIGVSVLSLAVLLAAPLPAEGLTLGTPIATPGVPAPTGTTTIGLPPVKIPTVALPPPPPLPVAPRPPAKVAPVRVSVPVVVVKAPKKAPITTLVKAPTLTSPLPAAKPAPPSLAVPPLKAPSVPLPAIRVPSARRTASSTVLSRPNSPGAPAAATVRETAFPTAGAPNAAGSTGFGAPFSAPAGSASGYGASPPPLAGSRAVAEDLLLRATVGRLGGCLGELPSLIRLVLERRAGAGTAPALSVAETASSLHVTRLRIARLERRGLGLLRRAALTHGCAARTAEAVPVAFLSSLLTSPGVAAAGAAAGQGPIDVSGVDAARYSKAPASEAGAAERRLIEAAVLPAADQPLLVVLAVVGGLALLSLVIGDALGVGPRNPRWRARWLTWPPRRR